MTNPAFAAHIVTSEAHMGDPAVIIMAADADEAEVEVATYPLDAGKGAAELLSEHGWRMISEPESAGTGYTVVRVYPDAQWHIHTQTVNDQGAWETHSMERGSYDEFTAAEVNSADIGGVPGQPLRLLLVDHADDDNVIASREIESY